MTDPRFLFFRLLGWILVAPLAMRLGPARAFSLFRPAAAPAARRVADVAELVARADRLLLLRVRGRLLFRTRCYKRTLVLYRLLRLCGHDARAVIGVDRDATAGIAAHAWLTLDGRRLEDPTFTPPRRFMPLLEIGERVERLTGV